MYCFTNIIIFMYTILTKTCKILHYWNHNVCMLIVIYLLLHVLKKFWCQLPADGKIVLKHGGAMLNIVGINHRLVHWYTLVLHKFFNFVTVQCALRVRSHDRDWKSKVRKKGKQGRTTGMQMSSGGRNTTNDNCESNLPWIQKNLWQQIIYWGDHRLCEHKAYMSCLKNGKNNLEYAQVDHFTLVNNFELFSGNMDENSFSFFSLSLF